MYFEVPHLLSPVFPGRDADIQRVTESFMKLPLFQRQHQQRYVLFGLGGSGKTEIYLKYVQDQRERCLKHSNKTNLHFANKMHDSDTDAYSSLTLVRRRVYYGPSRKSRVFSNWMRMLTASNDD